METGPSVVGTAAIVALGRWSQDKSIDMRYVVGTGIYAVIISLIEQGNTKLAQQFALLVFVGALFMNVIPVASKLGFLRSHEGIGPK